MRGGGAGGRSGGGRGGRGGRGDGDGPKQADWTCDCGNLVSLTGTFVLYTACSTVIHCKLFELHTASNSLASLSCVQHQIYLQCNKHCSTPLSHAVRRAVTECSSICLFKIAELGLAHGMQQVWRSKASSASRAR
jgi:hypothetical protein